LSFEVTPGSSKATNFVVVATGRDVGGAFLAQNKVQLSFAARRLSNTTLWLRAVCRGLMCPTGQSCDASSSQPGCGAISGSNGLPPMAAGSDEDAGPDASGSDASGTIASPADAQSGERCAQDGAQACAGHAGAARLICEGGRWASNGDCDADARCDPNEGATRGQCLPVPSACLGHDPSSVVCDGTVRRRCDADLLHYEDMPCAHDASCSADGAAISCQCNAGFSGDGEQTCNDIDECANDIEICGGFTCRNRAPDYECSSWTVSETVPVVNADTDTPGVLGDRGTRLMWERTLGNCIADPSSTMCTWAEAKAYCDGLSLAGFDDWRVPTVLEQLSIIDMTRFNVAYDPSLFLGFVPNGGTWTIEPYLPSMQGSEVTEVWYVNNYHGSVDHTPVSKTNPVRCVRTQ
jgi:hypothetical protein